jgi:putative ABC transport system ATP-binding protein
MLITIKDLKKTYNKQILFEHFNLEIPERQLTVIHGISGAGKSTLLNIIGLIEDYDDGKIQIFGRPTPVVNTRAALLFRRQYISYLFQNFALIEDESIEKNLNIALVYSKLSAQQKQKKMKEVLAQVNLQHSLKAKVYSLSGGEKQRVAVARALLKDSELILADEPTGSVDKINRDEILKLLQAEVARGKTVVIVSHDPSVVSQADFVVEIGD